MTSLGLARALTRSFQRSFSQKVPQKGARVIVAMSGGVDSSVTAKLLAQQDYDLSAVFMRNWDTRDESGTDKGCEWEKDWEDVQRVCKLIDAPCRLIDLSQEYWTRVFEPSLKAWESGDTPNPDIWCNREVKFGALLDRLSLEVSSTSWLATGHYAIKGWSQSDVRPRPQLRRARDRHKDQTYYLSSITESSLARAFFPLGHLTKPEVKEIARKSRLPTAHREESMGICFVGEKRKFNDFISQYIPPQAGPIVEMTTGRVIGTHQGLSMYTIGQGAKIRGMPQKMFVAKKDPIKNEVYVVPGSDHPALYCKTIRVRDWHWIWLDAPPQEVDEPKGLRARMQFRHVMSDIPCTVARRDETIFIHFDEPQKAVASGQVATVWDDDWCLGCGIIVDAS